MYIRKCEYCNNDMILKTIKSKNNVNYGQLIVIHKNKRFCSNKCQIDWQKNVSWEDRVGKETADKIRNSTSIRVSGDKNPSKNKETSKKISESIKNYLKENPRLKEKNGMYNKTHTEEYKIWASESRKGKRSYDDNGYMKQKEKTPKGENHPNWIDGSTIIPYPSEFNKFLKTKIKNRDGCKCMICSTDNKKLAIHHIDYNKDNINDNNLITLCQSCHSKTNFSRNYWYDLFINLIIEKYYL